MGDGDGGGLPTRSEEDQAAADERINAALKAYEDGRTVTDDKGRERPKSKDEISSLWETLWAACDFSWAGLADAGWDRADDANFAQNLKQWRAPAAFPGGRPVQGEGEDAWRPASLQDYWRWSIGVAGFEDENRLLSDQELRAAGLLITLDGVERHVVHCRTVRASVALDDTCAHADLQSDTPSVVSEYGAEGAALGAALMARLVAAQEYRDEDPDGRCQLMGARAQGLDDAWRAFATSLSAPLSPEAPSAPPQLHINAPMAHFETLEASGLHFGKGARFSFAQFGDEASFNFAQFGNEAFFESAQFGEQASFSFAQFGNEAFFESAQFGGRAAFDGAEFGGDASWRAAEFKGYVSFKDARWGFVADKAASAKQDRDVTGDWRPFHFGAAFQGARFRDVADFQTGRFAAFAAFDGAEFERRLLLADPAAPRPNRPLWLRVWRALAFWTWGQDQSAPDQRFADACKAVDAQIEKDAGNDSRSNSEQGADARWSQLSGGYRTAKKKMEDQGDFERAQRYYRFEVQARVKKPSVKNSEKFAAWAYGMASDYGASLGRPILALGGASLVFSLVFLIIAAATVEDGPALPPLKLETPPAFDLEHGLEAMEFSVKNAFRPLSALSVRPPSGQPETLADQLLFHESGGVRLFVKGLAVIQSLMSIMLAFLFGLAVRRKFQIS